MNYYERHLGDYAKDTVHLTMIEHGAYGLLLDRYYATEAPIPADQVHRLTRARTKDEIKAVDAVLSEFFRLCDGAWVNTRAEAEIAKKETKVKAAQANGARGGRPKKRQSGSENETQQKPSGLFMGSENETQQKAHQSPDTSNQTPIPKHAPLGDLGDGPVGPARASPAGIVCLAIRGQGIADANPSHPDLLALLDAGAGVDVFIDAAVQSKAKGKGFRYVIGTVKGRMEDAAKTAATELAKPSTNSRFGGHEPKHAAAAAAMFDGMFDKQFSGETFDA